MFAQDFGVIPEAAVDSADVFGLAREEQPARARVEGVGKGLHPGLRIGFRIHGHGDEKHIAAHCLAQLILDHGQTRRGQRTDVRASCVDEAHHYLLALNYIIIKFQSLAILCDHRQIGEIILAPRVVVGGCVGARCPNHGNENCKFSD